MAKFYAVSKEAVRQPQFPSGGRRLQKANAIMPKGSGNK